MVREKDCQDSIRRKSAEEAKTRALKDDGGGGLTGKVNVYRWRAPNPAAFLVRLFIDANRARVPVVFTLRRCADFPLRRRRARTSPSLGG